MNMRRVVTATAAAALATGGIFAAAPAYAGHVADADCQRLNHTETAICLDKVKLPATYRIVNGGRVQAIPSGRARVRFCRDTYRHPGKELTACLGAISNPYQTPPVKG